MTTTELKMLCRLLMVNDPWPLSKTDRELLEDMINHESRKRGYKDWIVAYHELAVGKEDKG